MKTRTAGTITAFIVGIFTATAAHGTTYYLKTGATDFSVAAGYTMDNAGTQPATTTPGADDVVMALSGTYAIDASSASFATLSGVKWLRPYDGVVFEITVSGANDEYTFNAPVNWNGSDGSYYTSDDVKCYGKIVKKGPGTLILAASGLYKSGTYLQDYLTAFDVQAGTLKLPQYAVGAMYFGDMTLAADTKLVTCCDLADTSKSIFTYVRTLNGYGVVTNESGRSAGQGISTMCLNLYLTSDFHGKICYPAKLWLSGRLTQYGDSVGFTHPVVVESNYGNLNKGTSRGTYSFEDVALLGPNSIVEYFGNGGGIHYFGGTDATINKVQSLYTQNHPAFVDAGWHGGLTFSAAWQVAADNLDRAQSKWIVLLGSNLVPCVISGNFNENNWEGQTYATETPRTIFTQKLGSGAWRFTKTRYHGGGFAIEEGSLQFDSIAEKGEASALGRSTNLTTACAVRDPSPYRVDYAFALGSTKADAPAAAFEFTGSESSASGTRPLVLAGKGGSLRASGTAGARLGFLGISARDAGDTTLTLDGTNKAFNVAGDITDGKGTVSVVKDGEGDWYLSGTNSFSGDLHVKKGTLTVLGTKYSWFRFTIREPGNRGSGLEFREVALYDANGIRQNICLKVTPPTFSSGTLYYPYSDWLGLEPGAVAFGSKKFRSTYTADQYLDQLFDDVGNTVTAGTPRFDGTTSYGKSFKMSTFSTSTTSSQSIRHENPDSWVPFVMRLTNGAPEIVAYDIESMWHTGGTNTWPKIASMEASVDGVRWNLVETNAMGEVMAEHNYDFSIPLGSANPGPNAGYSNRWFSDGTAQVNWTEANGTKARPGAGFPMLPRADLPMPLQNVRSVSVDEGATLRAEEAVVLHALKVDAAGAGTLDGFAFAQSGGTLDVTLDADESKGVTLPGAYVNCTGLDNVANWGIKVNGSPTRGYRAKVVDGSIILVPKGTSLLFR